MKKSSSQEPRPWKAEDFYNSIARVHALPIIVLEKWEREGGAPGTDYLTLTTEEIQRELVSRGLLEEPQQPRGAGSVVGGFVQKQRKRNLAPPFVEKLDRGVFRFNLRDYVGELKDFRERYPIMGKATTPPRRAERKEAKPIPEPEMQDEIRNLLAPLEQALRDRQQDVERLTEENQKLQAELAASQAPEMRIADEELRNDCAELLENEKYYINAIRSAAVVLEERLRNTMGGIGASMYGTDLVDMALAKDSGRLVISEHPNEQQGVHMLFRGAVQFVRNPPMHKKLRYTELEARGAVALIDYLLLLLRQAKPRDQSV